MKIVADDEMKEATEGVGRVVTGITLTDGVVSGVVTAPIEPGLPSPFQSHSRNWIDKTRIDHQAFCLGHDRLSHELSSMDAAHDASEAQRKAEYDAETMRIAAAHDLRRDELVARIADMATGMEDTATTIRRWEDRQKPITENERE